VACESHDALMHTVHIYAARARQAEAGSTLAVRKSIFAAPVSTFATRKTSRRRLLTAASTGLTGRFGKALLEPKRTQYKSTTCALVHRAYERLHSCREGGPLSCAAARAPSQSATSSTARRTHELAAPWRLGDACRKAPSPSPSSHSPT